MAAGTCACPGQRKRRAGERPPAGPAVRRPGCSGRMPRQRNRPGRVPPPTRPSNTSEDRIHSRFTLTMGEHQVCSLQGRSGVMMIQAGARDTGIKRGKGPRCCCEGARSRMRAPPAAPLPTCCPTTAQLCPPRGPSAPPPASCGVVKNRINDPWCPAHLPPMPIWIERVRCPCRCSCRSRE